MEDNFRVRADKVFCSLGGDNTASSVGLSSSLWCLGDEEIERREWNRNKDLVEEEGDLSAEYRPVIVPNPIDSDLQDLCEAESDEEEEEEDEEGEVEGGKIKRRRNDITSAETIVEEYFDVQSNIGRDCTLDYEEEEDQYDKVAVGTDQSDDRIFMRDVQSGEYEPLENEVFELPNTLQAVIRDSRANHTAAKIRLQEDDTEVTGNFNNSAIANSKTEDLKMKELDIHNPKPILKKRENLMKSSLSQKRVSFVLDPESSSQGHEDRKISGEDNDERERAPDLSLYSPGVPDYLMNPSKYTRYSFDASDDMDEQSNRKAHMEFFDQLRKRNNTDSRNDEVPFETPKSVVFMPRKKNEEGSTEKRSKSEDKSKSWSVGLTAEDNGESEVSAMEEDEPCQAVYHEGRSSSKAGRRYRARTNNDVDDNSN
ncbi:hypothetical protein CASFOL_041844 [Castilleja foliolosa]|uniref:U5 small nuclear ribonucleoprotein TSSC4 n=1 Tax=Castilleja foliolosa TaxID=1961234 RepID=A0ABD3B8S6_9LAMI